METAFLGTPDTSAWLFSGLVVASFFASYFSIVAGTAGGLMLLVLMASFYPPAVLIPMHTLIQLGQLTQMRHAARRVTQQLWCHV